MLQPRLTEPQRRELTELSRGRQPTFGKSRTRVQNTLCKLGLARLVSEGHDEWCEITDAGRAALDAPPPLSDAQRQALREIAASPDYRPNWPRGKARARRLHALGLVQVVRLGAYEVTPRGRKALEITNGE